MANTREMANAYWTDISKKSIRAEQVIDDMLSSLETGCYTGDRIATVCEAAKELARIAEDRKRLLAVADVLEALARAEEQ